ncbi:hypothetical protein EV360DRAFT_87759 [Lentinula raphanica]|nr:hypothetical protein EV360DRAFT_87759 [Lentinula raphanica]
MAVIPSLSDGNTGALVFMLPLFGLETDYSLKGSSNTAPDSAATAADSTSDTSSATSTSPTNTTPTSTPTSSPTSAAASTSPSAATSAPATSNPTSSPTSSASATSHSSSSGSSSNTSGTSSSGSSGSASPTSTISSTLTAAMTTSVEATVMSTASDGRVYTTVIETASVLSAGSIVTSTASPDDNGNSSSSNTAEIVGGVIGGVGGLAVILAVLFFFLKRQNRKRQLDEAFDGNFDPDRIVKAGFVSSARDSIVSSNDTGGYAYAGGEKAKNKKAAKRASKVMNNLGESGGTLPDIPIDGDSPMMSHSNPEMQQLMSVGSSSRNNLLDEEGMDDVVPPSPSPYHSPFHNSFSVSHSASSDGHGGISRPMSPPRSPNGRPLSISASTSLSGHGHPGYGPGPGYSRPPSFYGNNVYSNSPPGSPSPHSNFNAYGGYPIPPGRSPSPGASSAYGIAPYPNPSPVQNRRYSNGPDVAMDVNTRRASYGPAFPGQPSGLVARNPDPESAMSSSRFTGGPEEIPPTYDSINLGNAPRPVDKA